MYLYQCVTDSVHTDTLSNVQSSWPGTADYMYVRWDFVHYMNNDILIGSKCTLLCTHNRVVMEVGFDK